jgi:D-erythronate 2-dehydrogenase
MRILITGARGFIGTELIAALLARGSGDGAAIEEIVAMDLSPAVTAADPRLIHLAGDASRQAVLCAAFARPFDLVFALGATLTTQAESDFDLGLEVNVQGFLRLLQACRAQPQPPRLVFTSSIAAFGGPLPQTVEDDCPQTPQTSYGTHKAIVELLLNDASRRGFVDGRALRLPIVVTRPGPPTPSISDRIAALIRDPLRGLDTVCPLQADTRIPLASVQSVAQALIGVAALPAAAFGHTRAVNLPALSVRVGELVEAVQAVGRRQGGHPVGRVDWQPDAATQAIVDQWPRRFDSVRARALGLAGSASLDALIDDFVSHSL